MFDAVDNDGISGRAGVEDAFTGAGQKTLGFLKGQPGGDGEKDDLIPSGRTGAVEKLVCIGAVQGGSADDFSFGKLIPLQEPGKLGGKSKRVFRNRMLFSVSFKGSGRMRIMQDAQKFTGGFIISHKNCTSFPFPAFMLQ